MQVRLWFILAQHYSNTVEIAYSELNRLKWKSTKWDAHNLSATELRIRDNLQKIYWYTWTSSYNQYISLQIYPVYGLFDATELCKFFVSTQRKDAVKLFSDPNSWRTDWGREQDCHRTRHIHNSFPSADWAWSTPVLFYFADCFGALSLQASGSSNFLLKRKTLLPYSAVVMKLRIASRTNFWWSFTHQPSFCEHKKLTLSEVLLQFISSHSL